MSTTARPTIPKLPCEAQIALEFAGEFARVTVLRETAARFVVRLQEFAYVNGRPRREGEEIQVGKGAVVFPGQQPPHRPHRPNDGIHSDFAGFADSVRNA